jgi:type 1 glutamine amidotransferase
MTKLRALLLTGGAEYHNRTFHVAELAGILAGEAGADLRITDDLGVLSGEVLTQFDALVNWSTFVKPSPAQVEALIGAVEGGLGLFPLHAGNATFWNSAPYLTMIGSRFVRHDPYKLFKVEIDDPSHPITAGVEDFEVEDELYEVGGDAEGFKKLADGVAQGRPNSELRELGDGPLPADLRVLASAEGHPLLYVKTFGRGRIHYNALGHDTKALTHPSFRQLVRQGLAWVAGRE